MNTRFPTALVGTTQSTNGTFAFDASPVTFAAHPDTGLEDGETYAVYIRWPDNTTAGFLEGFGTYSATGNGSITITHVVKSTAGVGADYTFAAGTKHLAITAAGSELANMASVFIELEPWYDLVAGAGGQSNVNTYNQSGATDSVGSHPNVLDWCTAGTGTTADGWRIPDPGDVYTGHPGSSGAYTGYYRNETPCIPYEVCKLLADFMGRKIRLVQVAVMATGISHATLGWGYDPTVTTRGSTVFADTFADAMAQMVTDDPSQAGNTVMRLFLWLHGENDITMGSGEYGCLLARLCYELVSTDYYGIAADSCVFMTADIPIVTRALLSGESFDGHAFAKRLVGDSMHIINTDGAELNSDRTHYTVPGAKEVARRFIASLASTSAVTGATGGTWRMVPYTVNNFQFAYKGVTDTVPTIGELSITSTAPDRLRLSQYESIASVNGPYRDALSVGSKQFKIGDVLKLIENTDGGSNYYLATILSDGVLVDSTYDYVEYEISLATQGTPALVATDQVLVTSTTGVIWDRKTFTVATHGYIQSDKVKAGAEAFAAGGNASGYPDDYVAALDYKGRVYRTKQRAPLHGQLKTTTTTAANVLTNISANTANAAYYGSIQDGEVWDIEGFVVYKNATDTTQGKFTFQGILRRSGSSLFFDAAPTITMIQDGSSIPTDPTLETVIAGSTYGFKVRVTGLSSKTMHWFAEARITSIPTVA